MASKRHLRRVTCEAKRSYPDQESVARAMRFLRCHYNDADLGYYHCRFCGQWHIGHQPGYVREMIAARRD